MSDFDRLDYYELLGVSRSASLDEIKRAYRREISKYHPDRFINATPEEQQYAQLRSQHLTEAYAVLGDLSARNAYNRGRGARMGRPPRPAGPPQQRDHQAELYEQAQIHLEAGRLLQAIGALRQLQQINPFYRDSAEMLAATEAQLHRRSTQVTRRLPRPLLAFAGLVGGIAVIALAAWALSSRGATAGGSLGIARATAPATVGVTTLPTRPPEPTIGPDRPTTAPIVAVQPTAVQPTEQPTVGPPTEQPTAASLPATPAVAGESGQVLFQDRFATGGWADMSGPGWQVGYRRGRYHVRGDAGTGAIWSYRTAPAEDISIGVDVQVPAGEGGLLVRFLNQDTYVSVTLNPSQTSFRIEQHGGAAMNVLAGGQSEAIAAGDAATNRLVVRLRGERLQVLVNGQQVADVTAQGMANDQRYGLLVIAKESASEAYFDNLEIRALDS